jgi:signal transduction histidine kinase
MEVWAMIEATKCREIFDSVEFEVYAVDISTDKVVYANQAFRNNRKDIDSKPCYTVINGREEKCSFCKREELLDDENRPNGKTIVYDFFNELDEKWYQLQEKAAIWDDGAIVKYVTAVDISKLKETQNRLAEAHAELAIKNRELEISQIQQAKQAQLGELLDLIAHQWKQPLGTISILFGELKILQSTDTLNEESVLQIYTEGRKAIESMNGMLDSFRGFFNPSAGKVNFDALRVIGEIYELLRKKFVFENIEVEFPSCEEQIVVNGAPNEFAQAVLALLVNAGEAIEAKRQKNEFKKAEYKGEIKVAVTMDEGSVSIFFYDNGTGIKSELLSKIFENRFTTKGGSGGSGVGLAMARLIVEEKMGGKISAQNYENGACFIITLPALRGAKV